MVTDSPALWARLLDQLLGRHRRDLAVEQPSDSQWAPPFDVDDTAVYRRTPQPWPPPPPAPPAPAPEPDGPAGHDDSAAAVRSHRRVIAVGATVAVLGAWVGVAAFVAPRGNQTKTVGPLSAIGQGNGAPPTPFNSGGFFRRGTTGVIQSVAGTTVTVVDRTGQSVSVHTSASTVFTKTISVSVRQVKAGDDIVAAGVYSQANATLAAGRIAILGSGAGGPGGGRSFATTGGDSTRGTVTAVAGDHLTVTQSDGSNVTVVISPAATMTAPVSASLRDLAEGESITVRGAVDSNGDVDASQVQLGSNNIGFFGPSTFGNQTNSAGSSGPGSLGGFGVSTSGVVQS